MFIKYEKLIIEKRKKKRFVIRKKEKGGGGGEVGEEEVRGDGKGKEMSVKKKFEKKRKVLLVFGSLRI